MIKGTFCSFVPEVSSADGGAQTLVEGTIFNFEQDYRRSYAAWDKVGTTCLAHWFTRIGDRLLGIDVAVHEHGMHIEPDHTTERKRIVRHRWSLCRNGILRFSGAQKITWAPSKSNEPGRFTLYWKGQ